MTQKRSSDSNTSGGDNAFVKGQAVELTDKRETTRKRRRKDPDLNAGGFGLGLGHGGAEVGRTVKKLKKGNDKDSERSMEKETPSEGILVYSAPLADWKPEAGIPGLSIIGESSSVASSCSKAAVGDEADNLGGVDDKLREQDDPVKLGYLYRDIRSGKCFVTKKHKGVVLKSYERNAFTENTLRLNARLENPMEKAGMVTSSYCVVLPGEPDSDTKHPLRQHRTGALPFMAIYSLSHPNPRHSAVHDCESTLWLIIWVVCSITLRTTDDEELKQDIVREFINVLRPVSWQVGDSTNRKRAFAGSFTSCLLKLLMPIPFHPFLPVIRELAKLVLAYHKKSKEYHTMSRTFTQNQLGVCLKRYIEIIGVNMPKETSWDYINTGVVETKYEDDCNIVIADM